MHALASHLTNGLTPPRWTELRRRVGEKVSRGGWLPVPAACRREEGITWRMAPGSGDGAAGIQPRPDGECLNRAELTARTNGFGAPSQQSG